MKRPEDLGVLQKRGGLEGVGGIKDEVTPKQILLGAGAAKITMKMANDCHTLADPSLRVIADTANTCSKCVRVSDCVLA